MRSPKEILLVPKLIWLSASVPRDRQKAWDGYWGRVQRTGRCGDVLWDAQGDEEAESHLGLLREHWNPALPVVDVGCGNGTQSRALARVFGPVVGVDFSPHAIERARSESGGAAGTDFRVLDATAPGAFDHLAAELGPANVFVRGVLHVLDARGRRRLARNLLRLTAGGGRVFLAETDFKDGPLGYVLHLGATLTWLPAPLEKAIRGLPMPGRFGRRECSSAFPGASWTVVADGATTIEAVPMRRTGVAAPQAATERIPGYFAVLEPRS